MSRTFLIAEVGVNHNGDLNKALELIDIASESGADAVKFQTFISEDLSSKYAQKASYQQSNAKRNESQLEMLKKLELSKSHYHSIIARCMERNIKFMSTAFDLSLIHI